MLDELTVRAIAQDVVDRAKRTAHVDQGSLKKSIAYTYIRGLVTFRELYYGQWNNNSELEDLAKRLIPNGIAWRIVYTKLGGDTYEVGKTKQGRALQRNVIATILRTGTTNAKKLILKARGKKKDKGTD